MAHKMTDARRWLTLLDAEPAWSTFLERWLQPSHKVTTEVLLLSFLHMLVYLCDYRVAATRGSGMGVRGRVWASAPCAQAKSLQVSLFKASGNTGKATHAVVLHTRLMHATALHHTVSTTIASRTVPLLGYCMQKQVLNTVMGMLLIVGAV